MYNPAEYWEQRLKERFDLRAVGHQSYSLSYNYWLYERKRLVLEMLLQDVNLRKSTVLDVGSGTGFFLNWYQSRGALADGIDISPKAVVELKKQFPDSIISCLDFSRKQSEWHKQYDIVNAWDVIYHQTDEALFFNFLSNCARACKSQGLFICTDGFGLTQVSKPADHVQFRTRSFYQKPMQELGFVLKEEAPLYNFLNRAPHNAIVRRIHNFLGPIFYQLEKLQKRPARHNLSVSVWTKL